MESRTADDGVKDGRNGGGERGKGMSEAVVWSHQQRARLGQCNGAAQVAQSSSPSLLHCMGWALPPSSSAPLFVRSFLATRLGLFQKCPFLSSCLPSLAPFHFFPWTKMNAAIRGLICAPVSSVDRSTATNGTRHSRRGHLGGARAFIVGKCARRRFLCSHRK